jgi:phage recombination protein Bet
MTAIAIRSMTDDQVALVKRTICRDGTDDDLKLFIGICNATGLNPFLKQIYAVFRKEKGRDAKSMTVQTSIDGLRLTADRSGKYTGQMPPQWCGEDGVWREVWLDAKNPPAAARVGVLRSDFTQPCYGIATWASYAVWEKEWSNGQPTGRMKLGQFWERLGPEMLAKCAESLALRKAFPAETSGLRSDEEMAQSDDVLIHATVEKPAAASAPAASPPPSLPSPPAGDLRAELAAKRARAKADKAAKAAANPQASPPPGAAASPVAASPTTVPTSPAATGGVSFTALTAQERLRDLVARLGGDQFEDLACVLLEGSPDDRDRGIAESVRKATLAHGIPEADFVREAKRVGVGEGEIPTISQALALALLLPLPEGAAK